MNSNKPDQIVAKLKKAFNCEIWILLKYYKNRNWLDLRQFFKLKTGEILPTKKGICLDLEHLPQIKHCLEELLKKNPIICEFPIYDGYKVVAAKRNYDDTVYNELRIYYSNTEEGEWKPTPKGITFNLDLTKNLLENLKGISDLKIH